MTEDQNNTPALVTTQGNAVTGRYVFLALHNAAGAGHVGLSEVRFYGRPALAVTVTPVEDTPVLTGVTTASLVEDVAGQALPDVTVFDVDAGAAVGRRPGGVGSELAGSGDGEREPRDVELGSAGHG